MVAPRPSLTVPRHQLAPTWRERLARLAPFGLGHRKPRHFRDMLVVLWRNRDNLPHAWRVLTRGVCDGCALGVAGLRDWTMPGVHLCMTRLNLLRLNTVAALDPDLLRDAAQLGRLDNAALRELGRLAHPYRRRRGEAGFTRVSWEEATRELGARLRAADPRRLAFYVTARGVTNEVYYMAQKVARFLGTHHIDNAARLCHAPSGVAMREMLGVAASTCAYADWIGADVVVFLGSNPANDQPVSTKYLLLARRRGTRVVLVNPCLEPGMRRYWVPSDAASATFGSDLADHWFPVRPDGDTAFLYGTLKSLLDRGAVDAAWIASHTTGFEALRSRVESLDWAELEAGSGLPRASMEEFAGLLAAARSGVLVWSMGITQGPAGADAVRLILNVALARGWIGRDHCGVMPIRGHSSVQGGAEMGCYATALPGESRSRRRTSPRWRRPTGFPCPGKRDSRPRKWSRPPRVVNSTCCIASAATSCAPFRSPGTCARRSPGCRCACTRTSSSPTRCCSSRRARCGCCRRRRATSRTKAASRRAPNAGSCSHRRSRDRWAKPAPSGRSSAISPPPPGRSGRTSSGARTAGGCGRRSRR